MNERLTKQELREDPVATQVARGADFLSTHGRTVMGASIALIVVLAAGFWFRANSARSEDRASALLATANQQYQTGNYAAAATGLAEIRRNLGGTAAGKRAALLAGDVEYAQANYQAAADAYEEAVGRFAKDPVLGTAARAGLAASLENLGQTARAAELYRELAAGTTDPALAAQYRLSQARNLLLAGSTEEALGLYEELADTPGNPRVAQEAKLRAAELKGVGRPG